MYRGPPSSTDEWEEKKIPFDEQLRKTWPNAQLRARVRHARENVLNQFWTSFVEDKLDLEHAVQTKAEFSYVIAMMDRVGDWEEGDEYENSKGVRFAASMWICTKAVVCNRPKTHARLSCQQSQLDHGSSQLGV